MSRSSGSSIRTRTIGRSPEIPWAQSAVRPGRVAPQRVAGGPKRGVGVEDPAGEILEQVRLVRANPEMVQLDLRLRPRQRDRALEGRRVAILVGQRHGGVARRGDERGEDQAGALSRRETDAPSEAEDRIEHRARGVREGPAVDHRHRACGCRDPGRGSARGPSRTASPPPDSPSTTTTWAAQIAGSVARPATAGRQERLEIGDRIPSGRRGWRTPDARRRRPAAPARARRRRSARSLASAPPRFVIETPAHLGVVLRRDQHLERGRDGAVASIELGAVLGEGHAIGVRLDAGGLIPRRPHRPAADVPQEDDSVPQWSRVTSSRHRVTREVRRSGCSPSPPPSASPCSGRWRADASAASGRGET